MPRKTKTKSMTAQNEVALQGTCSIRDVAKLRDELAAVLEGVGPIVVNTHAVERVDTATVQLLQAFARECAQRSRPLEWRGDSHAFNQALRTLGLGVSHGFAA